MNEEQNTAVEQETRTFTQDELNAIIEDRLSRERRKYADYEELKTKASKFDEAEEASKSELQKLQEQAEKYKAQYESLVKADNVRKIRDQVSAETGVPANLLNGDDEESCKAQAEAIKAYAQPAQPSYPSIPDAGEVHKVSTGKTRDKFADWFSEQLN